MIVALRATERSGAEWDVRTVYREQEVFTRKKPDQ